MPAAAYSNQLKGQLEKLRGFGGRLPKLLLVAVEDPAKSPQNLGPWTLKGR
jgi:hypothetical protein